MRPGERRPQAHTLVELIIASALSLMMMVSVGWALVYCNSYLRNAETKYQAQTQALAASIWMSRNLSESNAAATCTTTTPAFGVSFPSPRDCASGDVAWDGTGGGVIVWRQVKFCYLNNATQDLVVKSYPLTGGTAPTIVWAGFPPYPTTGAVELTCLPQPLTAAVMAAQPDRVIAHNIRLLNIDLYAPTDAIAARASTANVTLESFVPYYGINYGVRVSTAVRLQN